MSKLSLYHGSSGIIESPAYGKGNRRNDYGMGFYCTEDIELAKEWACVSKLGGYANAYVLDTSNLTLLDLEAPEYGILNWLAILVNNRTLTPGAPIVTEGVEYLSAHFLLDIERFDNVKGYRADDSYFAFATDFLSNTISLKQLSRAMSLGELGVQYVLKSRKSFESLRFVRSEDVDGYVYFHKRSERDKNAREQYLLRERKNAIQKDDVFMIDILREEIRHGDSRLQ